MSTHQNILTIEKSLLIVVDIQTKLVSTMPETDAEKMLKNSSRLLKAAETLNIPVVVTEQYPEGLGHTDAQINSCLPDYSRLYDKTGFSCCSAAGLKEFIKNSACEQIILIGQEAHVCVLQTAFDLMDNNFQVYVVEDATCSRNTNHKHYALQRMQQHGATITNYESVLFEWLKNSKHADFKSISKLIR